jgi:hypothetical protein
VGFVGSPSSLEPFGDVGGDRYRCPAQLTGQSERLAFGERSGQTINGQNKLLGPLPDHQIAKSLCRLLSK